MEQSGNPSLDVTAKLDSSSVLQNAPPASSALKEMGGAARQMGEDAALSGEQVERLQESVRRVNEGALQSAFLLHRAAEGFKDIAMGGRMASQGFMDLEYALQRILPPQAAVYTAGLGLVGMLAMLALHHRRVAGEASAQADAEKSASEEVTQAWSTANATLKTDLDALSKERFFDAAYEGAKLLTAEIAKQAEQLGIVEAAEDKLTKAIQEQAIAQLNLDEQKELKGKTNPIEIEGIKNRYSIMRDEAKTSDDQQLKTLEMKRLAEERDNLQKQLDAKQKEVDAATDGAQRAYGALTDQRMKFIGNITSNEGDFGRSDYAAARDRISDLSEQQRREGAATYPGSTETIPNLTPAQLVELDALRQQVEELRQKEAQSGPSFDLAYDRAKKERDDIEKASASAAQPGATLSVGGHTLSQAETEAQVQAWTDRAKALGDYMLQIEKYRDLQKQVEEADTTRNKAYSDAQKEKAELQAKIQAKTTEIDTAGTESQTAGLQGEADVMSVENKAGVEAAANAQRATEKAAQQRKQQQRESEQKGEIPLQEQLSKDQAAYQRAQDNIKAMADHAKAMGEQGAKHAEQTTQLAEAMRAGLEQLRQAVERDRQALQEFKLSQKNNALN